MPDDDVIEHEASERCVCGPLRETVGIRQVGHTGQHVIALVHPRLKPDEEKREN
jgi:hypothetical protein